MTYAANGTIQASDLNNIVSTGSPNINELWSIGSGNKGYGQPSLASATPGAVILASNWDNAFTSIVTMADHQGTAITPFTDADPQPNNVIVTESMTNANLLSVYNNRLNAAAQGATIVPTNGSAVCGSTWTDYLQVTFNIQFASNNQLRYFFNSGGQMSLSFSHPASGGIHSINYVLSNLAAETGTMWLSSPTSGTISLSGLTWPGVKQVGGTYPAGATVYANRGFYALNGTPQILLLQIAGGGGFPYYYYYQNTYLQVSASTNGSGLLSLIVLWDELPNGALVTSGTTTTLSLRNPSTAYLTNSWGTPTVTNIITAV